MITRRLGPQWDHIAVSVFLTVLLATAVGAYPVLGWTEDGSLIFAIGVESHD